MAINTYKAKAYKCNACEYNIMEYSPFLEAYVFCCNQRKCNYEPRKGKGLNVVPRNRKREKEVIRDFKG